VKVWVFDVEENDRLLLKKKLVEDSASHCTVLLDQSFIRGGGIIFDSTGMKVRTYIVD
jgi:hypothetical protein